MNNKIYVGNLSYQTSEGDLEGLFGTFGNLLSVKIITDRDTGRSKGFGFVEMESKEAGEEAIAALNGSEHSGRSLRINEARPREKRPQRRRY